MNEDENCILNTPAYKEHVLKVKEYAKELGLHFNQAHAPFPTLRDGDEEYNNKVFPRVKRAIEMNASIDKSREEFGVSSSDDDDDNEMEDEGDVEMTTKD